MARLLIGGPLVRKEPPPLPGTLYLIASETRVEETIRRLIWLPNSNTSDAK
jgi:hypothetical protein